MAFTRVLGPGIHTASNINSHNINSTGIITAVSFVGNGAGLTGIASTDNIITGTAATFNTYPVDINAGMDVVGVSSFQDIDVDGHTNLDNVSVAGVTTITSSTFPLVVHADTAYQGILVNGNGAPTVSFAHQNTTTPDWKIGLSGGNHTALAISEGTGNTNRLTLSAGGGGSISGTFLATNLGIDGNLFHNSDTDTKLQFGTDTIDLHTGGSSRISLSNTGVSIPQDLDVDGHTNLDNVSIAGISTFSGILDATNTPASIRVAQDIQHKGDADTKIKFPSNDNISFEVGGVERLRIDNVTGNQVIARDATASIMRVENSTAAASQVAMLDLAPAGSLSGVQLKATSEEDFSTGANRTAFFTIDVRKDGTFSERLRIDSSGRVMIGTTTEGNGNADEFTISYINHAGVSGGDQGRCGMTIRSGDNTSGVTQNGYIYFSDGTSGANESKGVVAYEHSNDAMYFSTDQVARLRIDSSGRVLIGTSTEGHENANTLTLSNSGTAGMTIRSTSSNCHIYFSDATSGAGEYVGQLGYNHGSDYMFFHTGGSERFRANSSGITVTGTVDSASDVILKENIKTIDNALDKVTKLRGVEYDYKDNKKHSIGVIAQEVEEVLPELVNGSEQKSVAYGNIAAVLIEAIKEQNEVINKMKKEIEDLKG